MCGRAVLKPPAALAAGDESMHEETREEPEGTALDYAGTRCGRETAGPGSVGAREAVEGKRIASTLAITGTRSRSADVGRDAKSVVLSSLSSSAGKPFVGFLSVCSAVSRLEAAASLWNAACRSGETLHHRLPEQDPAQPPQAA